MLVDCDHCAGRAVRCDTCVVGLLLGPMTPGRDGDESRVDRRAASTVRGPGAGPPAARRRESVRVARSGPRVEARSEVRSGDDQPVVEVDPLTARPADFDTAERRALSALAGAGLIAPLRLTDDLQGDTNSIYTLTERHSLAG